MLEANNPENIRYRQIVWSLLVHRLRRWLNIDHTLGRYLVFLGIVVCRGTLKPSIHLMVFCVSHWPQGHTAQPADKCMMLSNLHDK